MSRPPPSPPPPPRRALCEDNTPWWVFIAVLAIVLIAIVASTVWFNSRPEPVHPSTAAEMKVATIVSESLRQHPDAWSDSPGRGYTSLFNDDLDAIVTFAPERRYTSVRFKGLALIETPDRDEDGYTTAQDVIWQAAEHRRIVMTDKAAREFEQRRQQTINEFVEKN